MLHTMKKHHKNKALGMQSFLSRVTMLAINIFVAISILATLLLIGLELFSPFGEVPALIASVSGLRVQLYR